MRLLPTKITLIQFDPQYFSESRAFCAFFESVAKYIFASENFLIRKLRLSQYALKMLEGRVFLLAVGAGKV